MIGRGRRKKRERRRKKRERRRKKRERRRKKREREVGICVCRSYQVSVAMSEQRCRGDMLPFFAK
jgi:hypothetical protein